MKRFLVLILLIISGCHAVPNEGTENGVSWKGSLKSVHHGDTSSQLTLERFKGSKNLFAVGPVAELEGEITVIDGKAYIARVKAGEVTTNSELNTGAAFLVWSEVEAWEVSDSVEVSAKSHSVLEDKIGELAEKKGIDTKKPFPFLIEGEFEKIEYHVLQPMTEKQKEDFSPGPGAHKEAALNLKKSGEKGKILGFYSKKHGGVFTHMGSNAHMHVLMSDGTSGHVDEIKIEGEVSVSFPSKKKSE